MSRLRPSVLAAKSRLAEGYEELRRRHQEGSSGQEVSSALSDLRDQVLLELLEAALMDLFEGDAESIRQEVALVAHGGYGRRDIAPLSDVDLMLLHDQWSSARLTRLAERILCDVFDAGLTLGHSVRTIEESCRLACQDAMICTSLVESRLLTGNPALFDRFFDTFHRRIRSRDGSLLAAVEHARQQERIKFGETVYLLEPNIKRSRGGLRDIHLLRWIGTVRYGTPRPADLRDLGALSEEDYVSLQRAGEFLLRLRNEMHFHAGRPRDVLDRAEQLRIAAAFGYQPTAGMLPVERFMRDYFRHTEQVSHIVTRFVENARSGRRKRAVTTALFGHRVEGVYRVGPSEIMAGPHGLARLRGNLATVMELVDLANLYDKQIAPDTWEAVRRDVASLRGEVCDAARQHFLSLMSHPARLGELLRELHAAGLLEQFIPAFRHARGLLQFNQYHKYTVDEHCLRAVEHATDFLNDRGPLGNVYRGMVHKRVLHLALLIHDLGKGYAEDHCQVGLRIARETGQRLGLDLHETESLELLVHNHLLMNHLAFRRDTSDERLIVRFAVEVGSPELMRMLYLVTAADLAAVGPGSLNGWKAEVITDLYHRAMQHLAGESPGTSVAEYLDARREAVRSALGGRRSEPWFVRQVDSLPASCLQTTDPGQLAEDLKMLQGLQPGEVATQGVYQAETATVRFTIGTSEQVAPGIFHRLTGALTSHGLQILTAEINTLADGLVLDRFWVCDPDYSGEPPPQRLDAIRRSLAESLANPAGPPPSFRRTWQMGGRAVAPTQETRIRSDNTTSEQFTILDIFTSDRPGLLYTITHALYELSLSVSRAKIGTFLDQVVDVFYVTDRQNRKIEEEGRLDEIQQRLLEVIKELESR